MITFNCFEEQKKLVEDLVSVRSVVGAEGCEQAMAEHVFALMSEWPYFKAHPEYLKLIPTENDTLKRSSVLALVKGGAASDRGGKGADSGTEKPRTPAVFLLGHIDTVETGDYGSLEPLATKPEELKRAFRELAKTPGALSKEVLEDLESGRYMFGRGALDMKAGVASHMLMLKTLSEDPKALDGSLIALFECDEEGDSHGMFTGAEAAKRLAEAERLDIKCGICSDYSSQEAAIYLGTIGKYLPCVMAFGSSSHVGQVFSSLDPNLLVSAITGAVDYNTAYCESNLGELTPPPVTLKQSDTKENYSVQTAEAAYAYFNWFALKKSEAEVLAILKDVALKEGKKAIRTINDAKQAYAGLLKSARDAEELRPFPEDIRVYTLKEYAELLGSELKTPEPSMDIRRFWIGEAGRIRALDPDRSPVILIFMAGISYPPITVEPDSELGQAAARLGCPVRTYYPFISDASFISLLGDIPAANLGTYGRDAHMYTERVDMPYSFETLPNLCWKLLTDILSDNEERR